MNIQVLSGRCTYGYEYDYNPVRSQKQMDESGRYYLLRSEQLPCFDIQIATDEVDRQVFRQRIEHEQP